MEEPLTDEEIRKRVKKRLEERLGLLIHVSMFFMVNLFMVFIYLSSNAGGYFWPMWVIGPWGIGLVFHLLYYYNEYGGGRYRRERYIQQEMERERERLYGYTKRKNDYREDDWETEPRLRLTEDGELTDSFIDDLDEQHRREN